MGAARGHGVDRAFKRIERHRPPAARDLERLVVIIAADIALHGSAFRGLPAALSCLKSADVTDAGAIVAVAGAVVLLRHLFLGGPAPLEPSAACGYDSTPDGLSCAFHPSCRP